VHTTDVQDRDGARVQLPLRGMLVPRLPMVGVEAGGTCAVWITEVLGGAVEIVCTPRT
jgi:hypothetical protein